GIENSALRYYSFNDLRPLVKEIGEQGERASALKAEQRNTFQRQVLKLANAIMVYHKLKYTLQPEGVENWGQVLADFQRDLVPARQAARAEEAGQPYDTNAVQKLAEPVRKFEELKFFGFVMVIPPPDRQASPDSWQTTGAALMDSARSDHFQPGITNFAAMAAAYRAGDASS